MSEISRHDHEEAQRRAALKTLDDLRHEGDSLLGSALARAGRRASDHFAARDATAEGVDDPAEIWGRRIGRALSLAAVIGLCAYLYLNYAR